MCLFTYHKKPKVAERDITVYKWLVKAVNGKLYTPFKRVEVTDDILDGKNPMVAEGEPILLGTNGPYEVAKGFIHTYATPTMFEFDHIWRNKKSVFFECVIPKGTEYYEGFSQEYASKQIRFVARMGRHEIQERIFDILKDTQTKK